MPDCKVCPWGRLKHDRCPRGNQLLTGVLTIPRAPGDSFRLAVSALAVTEPCSCLRSFYSSEHDLHRQGLR
jgi:hypothetical protein